MKKKFPFYLVLFTFLMACCFISCENLLSSNNSSLTFSIGEDVFRAVEETVKDVKGFSENSIVKIVATLLDEKNEVIKSKEVNKKMNEDLKESFIFSPISLNKTFKIQIDVFYKEGKIFTGLSDEIVVTEDNSEPLVDINIVLNSNTITYESDVELNTASYPKSYYVTGKYTLPFPYVDGYSFMGWYTKDGQKVSNLGRDNYLGDVSLIAKWKRWDGVEQVQINGYTTDDKLLNDVYLMQGEVIKLTTNTPGAAIYYTTDGSEVDKANGTLYTEAITFNKDVQIKAIAYKEGMLPSILSDKSFEQAYTVTFNNGGHGTAPESITRIKKDEKLTAEQLAIDDTNLGLQFTKWTDEESNTIATGHTITKSLTLTANWTNLKPDLLSNVKVSQKSGVFSFTWDEPAYADLQEVIISFSGKSVTVNKGTNKADIDGSKYSFINESEITFSLIAKDTGNQTSEAVTKILRYNPYNLTLVPVLSTKGAASNVKDQNPTVIELGDWPQTIKAETVQVDETKVIKINGWNCYKGDDGAYYVKAKGNPNVKDTSAPEYAHYKFSTNAPIKNGTLYYFKMEPLRWVLLNRNFDEKQLFLCDLVQYDTIYGNDNVYAGSNSRSEARDFLLGFGDYSNFNGDVTTGSRPNFLNNAFGVTSRSYLKKVTNVDDIPSDDPIFLLGKNVNELQNSTLGFITEEGKDSACWVRDGWATDFALCMGVNKGDTTEYWTRTPVSATTDSAYYVTFTGKLGHWTAKTNVKKGIRPGICIMWP